MAILIGKRDVVDIISTAYRCFLDGDVTVEIESFVAFSLCVEVLSVGDVGVVDEVAAGGICAFGQFNA